MGRETNKTAVVLGMSANGLSILRSLGRKGVPTIGVGVSSDEPGMYSKYNHDKRIAPPVNNEEEFLKFLISISEDLSTKAVLFPTADEFVAFMSKYRYELKPYFNFILPSTQIIESFIDKRQTFHFSQTLGIPHPETFFFSTEEGLMSSLESIKYPCILKPQDSHIWREKYGARKVFVINSAEELLDIYKEIREHSLKIIVQQIVQGPDHNVYQFMAFCSEESQILASFCCRKIRQYPPHFGVAALSESKFHPGVVKLGIDFINKMQYKGMIALEFKIDEETGEPVFIEANLRTSLFGELSVASGIDLPYIAYRYLAYGDTDVKNLRVRNGVRLMNLELDAGSYTRLRKNKEITFLGWVKEFLTPRLAHTYFALDDLKPWKFVYGRLYRKFRAKQKEKKVENAPQEIAPKRENVTIEGETVPSSEQVQKGINVLHFISSNGLFGAEKVILNLTDKVQPNGVNFSIAAVKNIQNPHLEVLEAAQKEDIKTFVIESQGKIDLKSIFQLKGLIKQNNIDILHTHNYKSDIIGILAAKMSGIPAVATAHGFTDMTNTVTFYEQLDRWVLKNFFNRVVVVTENVLEKFPRHKKRIIKNGLDAEQFSAKKEAAARVREQFGIRKEEILIGTVGRLSREKNQILLLKAMYQLVRKNDKLRLLIVGDGPEREILEHYVTTRQLDHRVIFTGIINKVSPVYQAIDLFVLPSLTEGIPLTILEAMASGVPVVATNVGGVPEIIQHGRTGLLAQKENVNDLVAQIENILNDPKKKDSIINEAASYVKEEYSLDKMQAAYRAIYQEVLS